MYSEEESVGDVDENDIFEQGDNVEDLQNIADNDDIETAEPNSENQDTQDKKVVKPKRVIKNPQPKLNEQTLKEPKGLPAILSHFENVKFKGRRYEEHDLNKLMSTYQYWCHRLIPKFSFDDCIARLEVLGSKKVTQTQLKRIRMGIDFDNDNQLINEDENHAAGLVDTPQDQFDQLLPSNTESVPASVPLLTEEQMERIQQNKEKAERIRAERLRNIKAKAQSNLQPSQSFIPQNDQPSTSCTDTIDNILDSINADEPQSAKQKKHVLESESEDESVEETTVRKSIRRHIVESDEDEEADNMNTSRKSVKSRKIIDSDEEEENIDISTRSRGNPQDNPQNPKDIELTQRNDPRSYCEANGNKDVGEEDENIDMDSILSEINKDDNSEFQLNNKQ